MMSKARYITEQIMPPAVATWAVFDNEDGTVNVARVHAWGVQRLIRDERGQKVEPEDSYTQVVPYSIVCCMLESMMDCRNYVQAVEADSEEEAIERGLAIMEARTA